MSRIRKTVLFVLAGVALPGVLLAAAGIVVLQTAWFRDQVRNRIVYELETATGGRVEVGGFDFDWRRLNASVHGLVIHGLENAAEAPLFRAESVDVGLRIISVLKKQVDLQSLAIREPRVNFIVYEDGSTNLPRPKARQRTRDPIEAVLDLAIDRIHVVNGTVQTRLRRTPVNFLGEQLRAQIFYEFAPARYRGEMSFSDLNVTPGEAKTVRFDAGAKFVLAQNRLDITALHLGSEQSSLDVRGTVTNFTVPRV